MQFVVFPLSAIGHVPHPLPALVDGLLTHVFLVGLPTALLFRVPQASPHTAHIS